MYNPNIHNRRSIRLKDHDYSIGSYSITIATNNRLPLFGRVINNKMIMNEAGAMIVKTCLEINLRFTNVILDTFAVMPEHFHGIMELGVTSKSQYSLSDIMQFFKSQTTLRYIKGVRVNHWHGFDGKLWQRNYYERIIRNQMELNEIRDYITNNPTEYKRMMCEDF